MKYWYELSGQEVLHQLESSREQGLTEQQVAKKQQECGKNEYETQKKDTLGRSVCRQLKDVSTLILIFAAGLSLALAFRHGEGFIEPIVIISIVIMNIVLAVSQERSAERALEALADLNSPSCLVLRNGVQQEAQTKEVVPGDIILLKAGALVPADARLLESNNLMVDESSITGESEASEKEAGTELQGKVPLGDQHNMVFSGCLVTAGTGTAVVTEIGMQTQMGKIAGYLNNTQKIKTPLQKRLDKVGKIVSFIAVVSGLLLFAVGMMNGEDFWSMMLLAVSLAVAAVPETLSLIVTLALTRGVQNMVHKNALIRKLPAVETLGNTSVICSDKTGTLTQNRMTIQQLYIHGNPPVSAEAELQQNELEFLKLLALASSAVVETTPEGEPEFIGDPTEIAIMRLLTQQGMSPAEIRAQYPKAAEIPFSSARKMMTVAVKRPEGGYLILTKGAVDRLPFRKSSDQEKTELQEIHDTFASQALRVIALGKRYIETLPEQDNWEQLESELDFVGFIGLIDPPRPEAKIAIAKAKKAGIRTIMITGDHAITAGAIAKEIGILQGGQRVLTGAQLSEMSNEELCDNIKDYSVYARVSPEDKIRIVEAWQENGEVVAMTGDGVNDAPALKAADVGIAMGMSGTEVAKSASDMILTDDNFATIVDAVAEGRSVYSNIRKTIYFLLVCNLSEVVVMLFAQLRGWGVLVTPVMLLLINVLGDGIPGLQLANEVSDPRIMDNGPIKRDDSFFSGGLLHVIVRQTLVCSLVTLVAFYIGRFTDLSAGFVPSQAIGQMMAFLVIGWTSILHIFNVRSRKSIFKRTLRDNPPLPISAGVMISLFAVLVIVPPLGKIFGLVPLSWMHWIIVAGLSLVPTIAAEFGKVRENSILNKEFKDRIVKHRHRHPDDLL